MSEGAVKDTTSYVNYVYNISSRGTTEVISQIMGMSGMISNVLGQLAFQTSSYLSTTEGTLLTLGTVATAGMVKATEQVMKFDHSLRTVQAIAGDTNISSLGDQAMDMSNKFGVAVEDMTGGLETLARAGVTDQSVMGQILEQGMMLSKLEGMDINTAMESLITTTNLLDTQGLDLSTQEYADAIKYQNQMIVSASEVSPVDASDIIQTLEHVGGYAQSTNLDQKDMYAVIAQLGAKGTRGEMAGTSLRAFLAAGQKDTAQRALDRIGLKVSDLWKDDNTMLSITDMKDVLDQAMDSKGYTQQEKLEFYSDFVGYKQANQIMKIDTESARQYKDDIDQAWSLGAKVNEILGSAQTNVQSLMQTGINFLTKVGEPFLPIISTIAWTMKTIIDIVDMIPFSNWIIAGGLLLVSIKTISTIFNKIGPQLIAAKGNIGGISGLFKDISKSVKESYTILKHWNDIKWQREKSKENEYNRITDDDKIEYLQKEGYRVDANNLNTVIAGMDSDELHKNVSKFKRDKDEMALAINQITTGYNHAYMHTQQGEDQLYFFPPEEEKRSMGVRDLNSFTLQMHGKYDPDKHTIDKDYIKTNGRFVPYYKVSPKPKEEKEEKSEKEERNKRAKKKTNTKDTTKTNINSNILKGVNDINVILSRDISNKLGLIYNALTGKVAPTYNRRDYKTKGYVLNIKNNRIDKLNDNMVDSYFQKSETGGNYTATHTNKTTNDKKAILKAINRSMSDPTANYTERSISGSKKVFVFQPVSKNNMNRDDVFNQVQATGKVNTNRQNVDIGFYKNGDQRIPYAFVKNKDNDGGVITEGDAQYVANITDHVLDIKNFTNTIVSIMQKGVGVYIIDRPAEATKQFKENTVGPKTYRDSLSAAQRESIFGPETTPSNLTKEERQEIADYYKGERYIHKKQDKMYMSDPYIAKMVTAMQTVDTTNIGDNALKHNLGNVKDQFYGSMEVKKQDLKESLDNQLKTANFDEVEDIIKDYKEKISNIDNEINLFNRAYNVIGKKIGANLLHYESDTTIELPGTTTPINDLPDLKTIRANEIAKKDYEKRLVSKTIDPSGLIKVLLSSPLINTGSDALETPVIHPELRDELDAWQTSRQDSLLVRDNTPRNQIIIDWLKRKGLWEQAQEILYEHETGQKPLPNYSLDGIISEPNEDLKNNARKNHSYNFNQGHDPALDEYDAEIVNPKVVTKNPQPKEKFNSQFLKELDIDWGFDDSAEGEVSRKKFDAMLEAAILSAQNQNFILSGNTEDILWMRVKKYLKQLSVYRDTGFRKEMALSQGNVNIDELTSQAPELYDNTAYKSPIPFELRKLATISGVDALNNMAKKEQFEVSILSEDQRKQILRLLDVDKELSPKEIETMSQGDPSLLNEYLNERYNFKDIVNIEALRASMPEEEYTENIGGYKEVTKKNGGNIKGGGHVYVSGQKKDIGTILFEELAREKDAAADYINRVINEFMNHQHMTQDRLIALADVLELEDVDIDFSYVEQLIDSGDVAKAKQEVSRALKEVLQSDDEYVVQVTQAIVEEMDDFTKELDKGTLAEIGLNPNLSGEDLKFMAHNMGIKIASNKNQAVDMLLQESDESSLESMYKRMLKVTGRKDNKNRTFEQNFKTTAMKMTVEQLLPFLEEQGLADNYITNRSNLELGRLLVNSPKPLASRELSAAYNSELGKLVMDQIGGNQGRKILFSAFKKINAGELTEEEALEDFKKQHDITTFSEQPRLIKKDDGTWYYTNSIPDGNYKGEQANPEFMGAYHRMGLMGESGAVGFTMKKLIQTLIEIAIQGALEGVEEGENGIEFIKNASASELAEAVSFLRNPKFLYAMFGDMDEELAETLADTVEQGVLSLRQESVANLKKLTGTRGSPNKKLELMMFTGRGSPQDDEGNYLIDGYVSEQDKLANLSYKDQKRLLARPEDRGAADMTGSKMVPNPNGGTNNTVTAAIEQLPFIWKGQEINTFRRFEATHGKDYEDIFHFDDDNQLIGVEANSHGDYRELFNWALEQRRNKGRMGGKQDQLLASLALQYGLTEKDIFGREATQSQQERVDQAFAEQEFTGVQDYIDKHGRHAFWQIQGQMESAQNINGGNMFHVWVDEEEYQRRLKDDLIDDDTIADYTKDDEKGRKKRKMARDKRGVMDVKEDEQGNKKYLIRDYSALHYTKEELLKQEQLKDVLDFEYLHDIYEQLMTDAINPADVMSNFDFNDDLMAQFSALKLFNPTMFQQVMNNMQNVDEAKLLLFKEKRQNEVKGGTEAGDLDVFEVFDENATEEEILRMHEILSDAVHSEVENAAEAANTLNFTGVSENESEYTFGEAYTSAEYVDTDAVGEHGTGDDGTEYNEFYTGSYGIDYEGFLNALSDAMIELEIASAQDTEEFIAKLRKELVKVNEERVDSLGQLGNTMGELLINAESPIDIDEINRKKEEEKIVGYDDDGNPLTLEEKRKFENKKGDTEHWMQDDKTKKKIEEKEAKRKPTAAEKAHMNEQAMLGVAGIYLPLVGKDARWIEEGKSHDERWDEFAARGGLLTDVAPELVGDVLETHKQLTQDPEFVDYRDPPFEPLPMPEDPDANYTGIIGKRPKIPVYYAIKGLTQPLEEVLGEESVRQTIWLDPDEFNDMTPFMKSKFREVFHRDNVTPEEQRNRAFWEEMEILEQQGAYEGEKERIDKLRKDTMERANNQKDLDYNGNGLILLENTMQKLEKRKKRADAIQENANMTEAQKNAQTALMFNHLEDTAEMENIRGSFTSQVDMKIKEAEAKKDREKNRKWIRRRVINPLWGDAATPEEAGENLAYRTWDKAKDVGKKKLDKINEINAGRANDEKYQGKLNKATEVVGKFSSGIETSQKFIGGLRDGMLQLSEVFPPLIFVVGLLEGAMAILSIVNTAASFISGVLNAMKVAETGITGALVAEKFAEAGITGVLILGFGALAAALGPLLIPLIAIAAIVAAIVIALKASNDAHKNFVKTLKENQATARSNNRALAIEARIANRRANNNRNAARQEMLDKQKEITHRKLLASQMSRQASTLRLARANNDAINGETGLWSKITNLWGGAESHADEYQGTTQHIRKVHEWAENDISGLWTTKEMHAVNDFYNANRYSFAMIDEYKDEMGVLYDAQTRALRRNNYDPELAKNDASYQRQLTRTAEATGFKPEDLERMLQLMEVENIGSQAEQAARAEADLQESTLEQQIAAVEVGADYDTIMGLHGKDAQQKEIAKAQADMVKMELEDKIWWRAFYAKLEMLFARITAPIRLILDVISYIGGIMSNLGLIIYHAVFPDGALSEEDQNTLEDLDEQKGKVENDLKDMVGQGRAGQKARLYEEAYDKIEETDWGQVANDGIVKNQRANYGSGGGPGAGGQYSAFFGSSGNQQQTATQTGNQQQTSSTTNNQHTSIGNNTTNTQNSSNTLTKSQKNIASAGNTQKPVTNDNTKFSPKSSAISDKNVPNVGNVVEQTNNDHSTTDNSNKVTIQTININTEDDPEAIKAMFLELIIELQEQINPRLVSRTVGEVPTATDTSNTDSSESNSENANNNSSSSSNSSSSNVKLPSAQAIAKHNSTNKGNNVLQSSQQKKKYEKVQQGYNKLSQVLYNPSR